MAPPFHRLSLEDFAELLARFPFTRRVNAVHLHHTWRPRHADFRGHDTIVAMWRHHTEVNGWSDIAQHVTIDPEGMIWLGRNWNRAPASASGHNGSAVVGPFMIEMIGDFDVGRDRLEGAQRDAALRVVALVQKRFELAPETLRFHREMSTKTCPGSGVDYAELLEEVRKLHAAEAIVAARVAAGGAASLPFGADALALSDVLSAASRGGGAAADAADAEPQEEEGGVVPARPAREGPFERAARGGRLSAEQLAALRPHVINLRQGEFSRDGLFATAAGDVDAIFDDHLAGEIAAARAQGRKLKLLFYAHGGLVSESAALRIAAGHVEWWRRNQVYPVYFVWETGLFETIGQLLERVRLRSRAAARDVWDFTTDPLVEAAVRALYGVEVWGGMKRSAERASAPGLGAHYTAQKLAAFCAAHGADVELHAVGHSAGSIFHAHFLPAALDAGVPGFRTVHFLAPALRVDLFKDAVAPRLGEGLEHLTVYTMRKDVERADHCKGVYRKSLLYLIHHALEVEREAPILGLEESLRADDELRRIFGLGPLPSPVAEVVWSPTVADAGRGASRATSHGGFDDDPATMNSVLRRVLDVEDAAPIRSFLPSDPRSPRGGWEDAVDWPDGLVFGAAEPQGAIVAPPGAAVAPAAGAAAVYGGAGRGGSGRRRALCVGIDEYRRSPLSGCVADARLWASTLAGLGFEAPVLLLNEQATRSAILETLRRLVHESREGDVVVFQFSGHGTQLPDASGDEAGEDTPDRDEALCPHDMDAGAFVLDDDVAEVFAAIPAGVNVTCFIDCCHSGTISRFGVGSAAAGRSRAADERPRFLTADASMIEAHRRFRSQLGWRRAAVPRGPESMREVLFSACRSTELAWESNGQGEFTLRATRILASGIGGLTNERFAERVRREFGPNPRQHPELDCAPAAASRGLLQPIGAPALVAAGGGGGSSSPSLGELLRRIADLFD